jgi:hypothetical protein
MGARPGPPIERDFRNALERGEVGLLSVVDQLLGPKPSLKIGATTITAYRGVHEVLASTLDLAARAAADEKSWNATYNKLAVELSRAKIVVNYQLVRGQISRDIATLLNDVLNAIDSAMRNKQRDQVRERAERGRVLIDALTVLIYRAKK